MSNFFSKFEDIERLISSNDRANRPFAYSSLLRLQEQSGMDPSSTQALIDGSLRLISFIVADISEDDEEIAAQALKCLGFTIYHPTIVTAISVEAADAVLDSLSKVITTTRMKSVCNLGVWCISMQQFDETLLSVHFCSLLRAAIHALDNPFGSLSTTFEAIQALLKLASQLWKLMRDSSHIWAPPVYRRLLSDDKREREISERCLLRIRNTVLPPPLALSKALVSDMNKKLLVRMKEMLEQGMKIQTIQAWGWFIRLLGYYAMENRCLVNNMLKVLEVTFADNDTQVQISSQVAWEGLIDALIPPSASTFEINTSKKDIGEIWSTRKLKSVKLIMVPMIGTISSKLDLSVQSSCLNTWSYLLHRLDVYINHIPVKKLVLEPVFDAVFRNGLENSRIWLWNVCLDLLDGSVSIKLRDKEHISDSSINKQTLHQTSKHGTSTSRSCSWSQYPVKWLPWDLCQVDFFIDILYNVVTEALKSPSTDENRSWACLAALRIFRSILKGIQLECNSPSTDSDDIFCCLKKVLSFAKEISSHGDELSGKRDEAYSTCLRFVQAITEELKSTVLGCSLFKVPLDIKYFGNQQLVSSSSHAQALAAHMDMVSPMVYLIILYFHVIFQLQSNVVLSKKEIIYLDMKRYLLVVLSRNNFLENLATINILLDNFIQLSSLRIWTTVAETFRDTANVKDAAWMHLVSDNAGYLTLCQFLSYPFFVYSFLQKKAATARTNGFPDTSPISLPQQPDLEHVLEVWSSFYSYISNKHLDHFTVKSLHEDIHSTLIACLQEIASLQECGTCLDSSSINLVLDLLSLCGNAVTCILEHRLRGEVCWHQQKNECDNMTKCSHSALKLAARFMELSGTMIQLDQSTLIDLTTRVLSSLRCWATCLCSKPDVLVFVETLSHPLLSLLSDLERHCKSVSNQLQLLWVETLNCLLRSEPSVIFDSSFLEDHAGLLEKTLDHQDPSICDPTISFWNTAYGEQTDFDCPPRLLHVLDRLSENGRINFWKSCRSSQLEMSHFITITPEKFIVTAKHNMSSKRVGLLEVPIDESECCKMSTPNLKRRTVLTEHRKKVSRAQQEKERDHNGHAPGCGLAQV